MKLREMADKYNQTDMYESYNNTLWVFGFVILAISIIIAYIFNNWVYAVLGFIIYSICAFKAFNWYKKGVY